MHYPITHPHTVKIGAAVNRLDIEYWVTIDADRAEERGWRVANVEVQSEDWSWHDVPAGEPALDEVMRAIDANALDVEAQFRANLTESERRAFDAHIEAT